MLNYHYYKIVSLVTEYYDNYSFFGAHRYGKKKKEYPFMRQTKYII